MNLVDCDKTYTSLEFCPLQCRMKSATRRLLWTKEHMCKRPAGDSLNQFSLSSASLRVQESRPQNRKFSYVADLFFVLFSGTSWSVIFRVNREKAWNITLLPNPVGAIKRTSDLVKMSFRSMRTCYCRARRS